MTEEYLHYIWKHGLFEQGNLMTTTGEIIILNKRGNHNHNAGPDFLEAQVKIGNEEWAGHVELHIQSNDWNKHQHHVDKAYNSVVLHVVYEDNAEVFRQSGSVIPTLELKGKFDEMGYWRYEQFVQSQRKLPCENLISQVDAIHISQMIERVLIERLEEKSDFVINLWEQTNHDWSETFYRMLAYSFGLKVNAQAMLSLSSKLPLALLRKHRGNAFQVESLFFGISGLLESANDDYANRLKREYDFLKTKYQLHSLDAVEWKFARMRPIGFPTVRLAQLSAVMSKQTEFFDLCIHGDLKSIRQALAIQPQEYWSRHFRFERISAKVNKTPSSDFIDRVLINAIIPTTFAYTLQTENEELRADTLSWLQQTSAESNNIVKYAVSRGFSAPSAFESQGILQLNKSYCGQRKCLNCGVGVKLIKL